MLFRSVAATRGEVLGLDVESPSSDPGEVDDASTQADRLLRIHGIPVGLVEMGNEMGRCSYLATRQPVQMKAK